jgi:homoserine kinase
LTRARAPVELCAMHAAQRHLEVHVPCSTSNLGPGFDTLGLALSLALRVRVRAEPCAASARFGELTGCASTWPRDATNLVWKAFELARTRLGAPEWSCVFDAHSDIPVARGLGSSSAAIAAGLLLASQLAPEHASLAQLLAWGDEMEGHPDNTTAALAGGCTLALPKPGGSIAFVRQELAGELGFAVAWPRTPLTTQASRAVLPREVAFKDALENPRRLAMLLEGLRRGDAQLIALGGEDRLHVPYRLPLIPGGAAALAAARAAGAWLATISGSGSALIAIGPHTSMPRIAEALRAELARADGEATAHVVTPVFGTPVVRDVT